MAREKAVLGPIAGFERTGRGESRIKDVDLGLLVSRLLLFDKVILRSIRFRELPFLVRAFGESGLRSLIEAGLLQFFCDQLVVVTDAAMNGVRGLPQFHFNVGIARFAGPQENLRKEFVALQSIAGLKNSQRAAIEEAVWNSQGRYPDEFGDLLLKQIDNEIRPDSYVLKNGILEQVKRLGVEAGISVDDIELRVEGQGQRVFRIDAPFAQRLGIASEKAHEIIQSGISSVANLSQRLLEMIELSALTGYREDEASLLFGKLHSLIRQSPNEIEEQFKRVITVAEIPALKPNQRIDVEKLMAARESDECRAFRDWLPEASTLSDGDLRAMTHGIGNRISNFGSGTVGKVLRFAATTAVGLIPGAGPVLGPGASAIDSFLVDRAIKRSAIVGFLTRTYPSLFQSP